MFSVWRTVTLEMGARMTPHVNISLSTLARYARPGRLACPLVGAKWREECDHYDALETLIRQNEDWIAQLREDGKV